VKRERRRLERDLFPDETLARRFALHAALGTGGLGELYRVEERASGAARVLRLTDFAPEPEIVAALASVVALHDRLAPLRLPLARVHACGAGDARAWYVADALAGQSLLERVRSDGPMAAGAAARLILPVVEALATLHEQRIFHQDLSPGNLFLDGDRLWLLELGVAPALARAMGERPGALTTPRVQSPEQLVADGDARSDLYAIGSVLYHLVTGQRAIGAGAGNLRLATRGGVHSPPLDDVAAPLRPILARALALRPEARPASAAALRDELARVLT
jgi:serine/threonine protein kinase